MSNVSINRQIGSIFVVIGTEVGAGILALPILIAHMGLPLGCCIMLVAWCLMTYTALLICEANLASSDGSSFAGMAKELLPPIGRFGVWVSFLLLLYTILVAYISAAGSAFNTTFPIGQHHLTVSFFNSKILLVALPVFVTAFSSHLIIPTLRTYLQSDAKVLSRVIIIGSIIPLILYLIWIIGVLGVIPLTGEHSFSQLFAKTHDANVGDILSLMKINLHNEVFYSPVSLFSNISVTTSFLGVSLALYHFLIDAFRLKRLNLVRKNILAIFLTFLLPLFIVWFFPNIFIKALGYVGLCCSVLLIIIPFFMIKTLRKRNHVFKIKWVNNNFFLYLSLILGCLVIIIQLFDM